jgi:hypothetical protein
MTGITPETEQTSQDYNMFFTAELTAQNSEGVISCGWIKSLKTFFLHQ